MSNHVEGKVVVITGAAGGFGRLVAQKAAALGARVVAADVKQAELKATVESIVGNDGEAHAVIADVTDRSQMASLAAEAILTYGAIDVMVNNAGVMPLAFYADHAKAAEPW